MAQEYDKVIRENIEAVILPLSKKLLGFEIVKSRNLDPKLEITVEREPDFLREITTETGEKFVLHLEFQTHDEKRMVYRMAEYNAIILRKYELPIRQFVIYLGRKASKMRTELHANEVISGFELKSMHDFDFHNFLKSDIPEEIILAILGDFGKETNEEAVRKIYRRIMQLENRPGTQKRYLRQLLVLSRLRKLETVLQKEKDMAIQFVVAEDGLYKAGEEKGIKKGEKRGVKKGSNDTIRDVIQKLLRSGHMSVAQIAQTLECPIDMVLDIKNESKVVK